MTMQESPIVERTFAWFALEGALASLRASGARIYMVGGAVRDSIVCPQKEPADIDLMTADPLSTLADALRKLGSPRVNRHGNLRYVLPDGRHIDVIHTRQFYGRARSVKRALVHFDASVNALAIPIGGNRTLDPLGGLVHLREGRVVLPVSRWATSDAFEDVHVLLRVLKLVERTGLRVENPEIAVAHRCRFGEVDWRELERLNGFGRQEAEERYSRVFSMLATPPNEALVTSR